MRLTSALLLMCWSLLFEELNPVVLHDVPEFRQVLAMLGNDESRHEVKTSFYKTIEYSEFTHADIVFQGNPDVHFYFDLFLYYFVVYY